LVLLFAQKYVPKLMQNVLECWTGCASYTFAGWPPSLDFFALPALECI